SWDAARKLSRKPKGPCSIERRFPNLTNTRLASIRPQEMRTKRTKHTDDDSQDSQFETDANEDSIATQSSKSTIDMDEAESVSDFQINLNDHDIDIILADFEFLF